ncbi:hypothetical protein [Pseudomonas sp. S36]|uniref:hypothetical protein n=1 Tax=Pseudomonas sp. S36 TaxID=2767447 RepID=UPI001912C884|nr:hypothetical protein [Pseudomonas sp. S36]MBK4989818.1 hypothetical protein [Pseudomonas sp. S36]
MTTTDLRDHFIRLNPLGLDEKDLRKGSTGFEDPRTHSDYLLFLARFRESHPEPLQNAEPIACMVGTAFWWTKEEAERDAAETGLPIVGLGPMAGIAPAEQHQGEPVAYRWEQLGGKGYMYGDELPVGVFTPWQELYVATDAGEVERLRSIESSYELREELLTQVKRERDRMIARTMELADQLAERDALLRKIQGYHWANVNPEERARTRAELRDMLSASTEPSAPVMQIPEGYCVMPRRLTAENGAKSLLLGEFKLKTTHECPECAELEEPTEGCEICDGAGEYEQPHTIPWDQIKLIYSEAVKGLALKQ